MDIKHSYTAANSFPFKFLKRLSRFGGLHGNMIAPLHVQLCPTNKCNLNCSFCSCSDRDKMESIPFDSLKEAMDIFSRLGTEAVTITGGGEPCCYPDLSELLLYLCRLDIRTGMVSNGLLLGSLLDEEINTLTWCRVSASSDRDIDQLLKVLSNTVEYTDIDWAFSYVVTADFDIEKCIQVIEFADKYYFTHVRLVSDLLNLEAVPEMHDIKDALESRQVNDDLVIYQDRQEYTHGSKQCRISLLKPVIAPDGWVYPCCGAQYAIRDAQGAFPKQMRMCRIEDIEKYLLPQEIFDGSICDRCYYDTYNTTLEYLLKDYDHEAFI